MAEETKLVEEATPESQSSITEQNNLEGADTSTENTVSNEEVIAQEIKPLEEVETSPETVEATHVETKPEDPVEDEIEGQNSGEMDFGAILEQFEQEQARFREGDLVQGKVVSITDRGVIVDFGYKSEGVVPSAEFMQDGEITVKAGDEVEVLIKKMETGEGVAELSRLEAIQRRSWEELERAHRENSTVIGRVIDRIKGGYRVDINGVEAFLPGSQIDIYPPRNPDAYKGQDIEAKVIKFNRKRSNVVLSRKVIVEESVNLQKAETLSQLGEGFIVEGKIKSLTDYGAFVDLGGIDGLLHVTDMSWGKLEKPSEMFKVGDSVQVKVLKFNPDKERVSLGYKQLIPDPWSSVIERYEVGSRLKGKVSSLTDYGAFIELEPGVEGLVHVTEMTWSKRTKHPNKILKVGQEVEVVVLGVDTKERRISLGIRQTMANPWETIFERYHVNSRVSGKVRNLTDFGAFIEIEEGVDGLVHVSDISHSKKIKHPSEILKKGQEVEAVVLKIDPEERRMSLSIKDLQPSSWDVFVNSHKPGDVVRGKISRFAGFGVFVELADDLEGLCHISELSEERIDKPEKHFEIGQEMDFKILRIEHDVKKIGLSARAVGKDEPIIDTKAYSTEAKSGMASLAELAKLKSGNEDDR
jgi:small subunit ribosomal protein S1